MADVFISYSRRVKEPTIALAGELVGLGYDVVYDVDLLPNDPKFEAVINGWIDEAGATITIWSEPALKSRWVPYEAKRAQGLNRLLNTHVEDFDPAKLPADFHGMHCSCVVECDTIYAALVEMQVRPAGKTEADLPPRAVLKRHAQEEWLNEVKDSTDPIRIERFIEDYRRLAMFREIAQDRLKRIAGRADARISPRATILRKPTDAELTALTVAWPGIQDTADPADIDDLLKDFGGIDHFFVRQAIRRLDQLRDSTPTKETTTDELAVSEAATLRLAPAMHTALIRRISLAADGALMASASHDKTVKLWALPEGRLVRTLRPPVGEGDEGKAYAVAIDPAGRWVAAGGWMKTGLDEYVTLFDSETGAVRARLGPLPHRVRDLEVSTDGARLAAGLGGANGIRLWEMAGWQPIGEDTDYGGDVYGLAFAADGRLASTSYDGHVRLYGPDGEMLAKARAPGGARPYGIAFDPGGARLAVGYGDSLLVDVLDAASLQPLYSADTAGLSGGNFFSVAWLGGAGAGLRLAAGGRSGGHRSERLFTWDEAGRGARQPWPGPANTITDLARTPDGGLALAGAEPSLAVYTPEGARRLNKPPEIADLRNKLGEHFTVSADGRRLRFGLEE
ncbi:MAG: TIR domain-containing protein, partial [Pseudomonadota bacterium]